MRLVIAVLLAIACRLPRAGDLTKEECVDAHSKGQDAKEQGKISLARKLFLTCAQSSCPNLVQGDCARFADELSRGCSRRSTSSRATATAPICPTPRSTSTACSS